MPCHPADDDTRRSCTFFMLEAEFVRKFPGKSLHLVQAWRVENPQLWEQYSAARSAVQKQVEQVQRTGADALVVTFPKVEQCFFGLGANFV